MMSHKSLTRLPFGLLVARKYWIDTEHQLVLENRKAAFWPKGSAT
jgi:hypothetical protein